MFNFRFQIFLVILLLVVAVSCVMAISSEVKALMDLKAAMDPLNSYLGTWTVNGDPCSAHEFSGVACNNQGKVANISLQGKGLYGELSPAISALTSLSGLYLHFNSLTGRIPKEISDLTQLTDLYLDVNNLTGQIPPEISRMQSLQVLQLSCNQLTGSIPAHIGYLKKLSVLAISYNHLSASIPPNLGNLMMLRALYLSHNNLSGPIPIGIANIPHLQTFDIRNNSLTGIIPPGLKKLNGGFLYSDNSGLCSNVFPSLRHCSAFDVTSTEQPLVGPIVLKNHSAPTRAKQAAANSTLNCNNADAACSNTSHSSQIIVVFALVVATFMLAAAGLFALFRYRRRKQKIGNSADAASKSRISTDLVADPYSKSTSPLVSLVYSNGWDPLADGINSDQLPQESLQNFRFNMEDVESATQYFSQANVIGKGSFSTVYRGTLRDGSVVAIKSINVSSCKAEEDEFVKGMKLLLSLRHGNLVFLKGFCCSRGRGECFLIYDLAQNGTLATYLDTSTPTKVLDWPTRVSLIHGIAKGVEYLHSENGSKAALVHRNLSAEKIVIDHRFNALILDSCLQKILADDLLFSALKVSAAMGYLAPEYIKTGHFTEKSDVYSFGVIVLQILSGKQKLPSSTAASDQLQDARLDNLIDPSLNGKFSFSVASKLANLGMTCTLEDPAQRPTMEEVVRELNTYPRLNMFNLSSSPS